MGSIFSEIWTGYKKHQKKNLTNFHKAAYSIKQPLFPQQGMQLETK
jgi:hypothetical protein